MAEGRGNRSKSGSASGNSGNSRMDDEPIIGNDLSSDEMDGEEYETGSGRMNGGVGSGMGGMQGGMNAMFGNTQDPIERVAQVYQFLRSPQVDQTIRRFVSSRKTRQLIAAGLSILEIVVILLPLMKKLGGRVNDMTTLLKQPSTPQRGGARSGSGSSSSSRSGSARSGSGRSSRALPSSTTSGSTSGSVH